MLTLRTTTKYTEIDGKISKARQDMLMYLRLSESDPSFLSKVDDAEVMLNSLLEIRLRMKEK